MTLDGDNPGAPPDRAPPQPALLKVMPASLGRTYADVRTDWYRDTALS